MPGQIRDEDLRRVRAAQMLALRINQNMTEGEIGQKFNLTPLQVRKQIQWAKEQGMLAKYESQALDELVPLAFKVFRDALANGDTQLALEVFKGLGVFKKPGERSAAAPQEEDTLEIHIRKTLHDSGNASRHDSLQAGSTTVTDEGSLPQDPTGSATVTEAELVEGRDEGREAVAEGNLGVPAESPRLPTEPASGS